MIKMATIIVLMCTLLFFTSCSQKTSVRSSAYKHDIHTFTQGDYELGLFTNEISKQLETPIHSHNAKKKLSAPLDEITLIKTESALRIIISGEIFDSNSATPIENATYILGDIIKVLNNYPNIIIQVNGHSDRNEEMGEHQELSDNRAITIAEILYSFESRNETYAKGCGDRKPLFGKNIEDDSISNARVEIYLYPNKEKMLDQCR